MYYHGMTYKAGTTAATAPFTAPSGYDCTYAYNLNSAPVAITRRGDDEGRRNGRWIIQKDNKVIISSYRHGKLCGQLIELYNYDGKYRISRIKAYANDSLIIDQSISNYGIGGININIKDNTDFIWPDRYNAPITDPGYQSYVYVFDRDGILEYEGNQIVLDFDDLTGPAEFVGIHKRYWEKGKPVTVEELGFRKSDLNDNK